MNVLLHQLQYPAESRNPQDICQGPGGHILPAVLTTLPLQRSPALGDAALEPRALPTSSSHKQEGEWAVALA